MWGGWVVTVVAVTVSRRSRSQGLRLPRRLARLAAARRLHSLSAALRREGNGTGQCRPVAWSVVMSIFSSKLSVQNRLPVLLVKEANRRYRCADSAEILDAAQSLLGALIHGADLLNSPEVVESFLKCRLAGLEHEVFGCILLDSAHKVLSYEELFRGTVNQTAVYPREVVKTALAANAAAIIFVHNHPSGASEPSRADELLTQNLRKALSTIGVETLDHLIVAGNTMVSMARRGAFAI